jgi:F-type H+-transporting ATPase subunit a
MVGSASLNLIEDHTLYSEPIAHIGSFPITNSLLTSWVALFIIIFLAFSIKKHLKTVPTGLQNFMEMIFELFFGLFDSVTGDRKKTLRYAPFVLAFFFFILINNWLGILPGVGTIGQVVASGGQNLFVPYLRGGTADMNTALALTIIAMVVSHILSVIALGFWDYFNKYINLKTLLAIPKKVFKDPTVLLINPIMFFVGFIEIIGELAKIISLSFRLFGNVFAGEVLLASMSALIAFVIPIPFYFLEVLVGLIQALIFAMLVLTYISTGTTPEAEEEA